MRAEAKAVRKMHERFIYHLEKACEEGSDNFEVMLTYPSGSEHIVDVFIKEKKDEEGWKVTFHLGDGRSWKQYRFELGAEVVVD